MRDHELYATILGVRALWTGSGWTWASRSAAGLQVFGVVVVAAAVNVRRWRR